MNRIEARATIEANIKKFGYHTYIVSSALVPRFAYTIGLSADLGFELAMPGSIWFLAKQVREVIDRIAGALRTDRSASHVDVSPYGRFELRPVDYSWKRLILTGAIDYYGCEIAARQIVPDAEHITVDTPDLSVSFQGGSQPIWRWRSEEWPYPVPSKTEVCTDISALQGATITRIHYLDVGEWEMFSKVEVTRESARMVPFATMLGADVSISDALSLRVGESLWRDAGTLAWHEWSKGPGSDDPLFDATKTRN